MTPLRRRKTEIIQRYSPFWLKGAPVLRRSRGWRWAAWAIAMVFTPGLLMAAYEPGFLVPSNNLSDVSSASSARTNLAVPPSARLINTTAPVTGGGDLTADRTIAVSVATATTAGTVPTPPNDATKCFLGNATFGGCPAAAPVAPTIYTSTLPLTLPATHNLLEIIEMATPAAGTINLPATPAAGLTVCIKDGKLNFATNIVTVKTTDSGTIDKVAGATGFAMNQNGQQNCFVYASSGTNWYVQ